MASGKLSEQCWVEQIPSWATKPFLLHVHYARRMPNIIYSFGLFKDAELIGVCTYGMPPSPFVCRGLAGDKNKDNVLELNRLVILPEYNGHNYGSFLISHSLKMLPVGTFVVSYADVGGVVTCWVCIPGNELAIYRLDGQTHGQIFGKRETLKAL